MKLIGKEFLKKEIEPEIKQSLKEIIEEILIEPFNMVEKIKEKASDQSKEPYVILFCGINGTSKTTTIAKLASKLKNNKLSCVLVAADTWRSAAIEQLEEQGNKIGVKVIKQQYGSDPTAVAYDGVAFAKAHNIDAVLIDTAGRQHNNVNLVQQMGKIVRVIKPNLKVFIGESTTGNDCIEQAKKFDDIIGIDAIILSKADIDERGGAALSISYVIDKPIIYLGTGQKLEDLKEFKKEEIMNSLGL